MRQETYLHEVVLLRLWLLLSVLVCSISFSVLADDQEALLNEFVRLQTEAVKDSKKYRELNTTITQMQGALLNFPVINEEHIASYDQNTFVTVLYNAFASEQLFLLKMAQEERGGEVTRDLIASRIRSVVEMYPLLYGVQDNVVEQISLTVYLGRFQRYVKPGTQKLIRQRYEKLEERDRLPLALLLASLGDANCEESLKRFTSKDANYVKSVFRSSINFGRKFGSDKTTPPQTEGATRDNVQKE
jgi:hypothetical protein